MSWFFRTTVLGLLALVVTTAQSGTGHPLGGAAPTFSDAVKAYAWANEKDIPLDTPYAPMAFYAYHLTGGVIEVTRFETGGYFAQFSDLASFAENGHVQVSAYGSDASCIPASWGSFSDHLRIYVQCRDNTGDPVNAQFNVVFISSQGSAVPDLAYAWADQVDTAYYVPDEWYSYNGTGGAIHASRFGTGSYAMTFAGMGAESAGHAQVSAYGDQDARCRLRNWESDSIGNIIYVDCHRADGTPVDSRYTVLFLGSVDQNTGFALANEETADIYTPAADTSANLNGAILATRSGAGNYGTIFNGLAGMTWGGMVLVSANGGATARHCNVGNWGSFGSNFTVSTRCYAPDGNMIDSRYSVLVTWPNRPIAQIFADGFEAGD